MTSVLLRVRQRETDRKKRGQGTAKAEMGAMQPPEAGKGKERVLPGASEGAGPDRLQTPGSRAERV